MINHLSKTAKLRLNLSSQMYLFPADNEIDFRLQINNLGTIWCNSFDSMACLWHDIVPDIFEDLVSDHTKPTSHEVYLREYVF